MSKTSKTSNALEILNRRFGNDADVQARLEEERVKSLAAMAIYDARTAAGLTQQQLAELVGTKQPVIARLEDADYEGHTVGMLNRVAAALNQRLELRFVPSETEAIAVFSGTGQAEVTALRASLVSEIRSLADDLGSEIGNVKAQLDDLKANIRNLSEPSTPVRPSSDRLWKMEETRNSKRTLKPGYNKQDYPVK